ncbi:obscurin [Trichonephila clavipes]|nr:obscurin [Trichonephila clavipes]
MDNNARKRAPPLAAIYTLRRSSTMPICRITGKSHSMDEHHYVPCMDDFPKFDRLSGCRITEKNQYFKDYKHAYPIIDLDGTARMVTEHDFHCRITAKYRAMAGHKYLYPVLGATTDKTVNDMVSVVEEESMRDVLIPTEVELIVKGGVEDVLKMKEGEYLFIYSKEGAIIPAAMKEIHGKGGAKQGRRHTLPAGLEAGASSELEEFRRSLRIKMLSEIKNPPVEASDPTPVTEVFDKIQEEVEVLKDVRKSRPKRPGKQTNRGGEGNQKRAKREDKMSQKENTIEESKEEDLPAPKISRLERYKMQFSAFESNNSNKDSGNRLTLVGAFDENEVVELDFGEPMSLEISEVEPARQFSAVISEEKMLKSNDCALSNITNTSDSLKLSSSVSETIANEGAFSSVNQTLHHNVTTNSNQNNFKSENILKVIENDGFLAKENSTTFDNSITVGNDSVQKMVTSVETVTSSINSKLQSADKMGILSEKCDVTSDEYSYQKGEDKKIDSNNKVIAEVKSLQNIHSQAEEYHRLDGTNEKTKFNIKEQENFSNGHDSAHEVMKTNEMISLSSKKESHEDKLSFIRESMEVSEPMNVDESEEFIVPKKVSYIPQTNISKNLMSELKAKLSSGPKKKTQGEKSNSKTFDSDKKDISVNILNGRHVKEETINGNKAINVTEKQKTVNFPSKVSLESTEEKIFALSEFKENGKEKIKVEDFEKSSLQFQKDGSKHKILITENGEKDFKDKSVVKKLKLDNQSNDTELQVESVHVKQTFSKDFSHNLVSQSICNGNSENKVSKFTENITPKTRDLQNSKDDSLDFKKDNVSVMESNLIQNNILMNHKTRDLEESFSKKIEGSQNKFNVENSNVTHDSHLNLISKVEEQNLFKKDDTNSNISVKKLEKVKNVTERSIDLDTEKCNGISVTHSATKIQTHFKTESDSSLKKTILDPISLNGTSNLELSVLRDEATTVLKEAETNKLKISQSILSDSANNSFETRNETRTVNNLSCEKSEVFKESELSPDKVKRDTHSQFPMSLDSNDPVSKTDSIECGKQPTRHSDTQGLQKRLPVSREVTSEESSVGENIPLSISDDKKVEAESQENEKQCQGIDVYVAIMDFKPMGSDEEAVAMKEGQRVEVIDASKPRRWLVRTLPMNGDDVSQEGWVPACYLEKSTAFDTLSSYVVTEAELDPKELEAMQNREAIVKELVETEEDFAKDMQYVVENYYKQMDNPRLPKEFRDRKGSVFGNFKDICDFHNNVLMKGVNYHAKEPTKLGKTFLRLERDFDMHANYCWNEARAQRLLREGPLKEFFDDHSRMIDDDKFLVDHLKLPIQRLNDYQLLLKELIKYSSRLNEDTTDLQKALDFIHSINTRTKDLLYIQAIEGCKGDLLKIGRILKHEVFDVCEGNEVSASERYVFLFKGRVFVTEKRITSEKESYHVTNLFRLQDVDLIETVDGDPLKVVFKSHKKNRPGFPLSLRARSPEQKAAWLKELIAANQVVEDFGDLEPSLEHPLTVSSNEHLAEKANDTVEQVEDEKEPVPPLKRQDSSKKSTKTPDSSVPQTPTETDTTQSPFKRQDSLRKSKRSSDASAPQTPTETSEKAPKLLRQDSKKSKASDSSAPETPTEVPDKRPKFSREDSKKSKASDTSAPETPVESSEKPPKLTKQDSKKSEPSTPTEVKEPKLLRQDSKKSKASDTSAPETPVESSEKPPPLSRQESKKSQSSAPETPVESKEPQLVRQDSKASDSSVPPTPTDTTAPTLTRQGSVKKKQKKQSSTEKEPVAISEEKETPSLERQESVSKKADKKKAELEEDKTKVLGRQDSLVKKEAEGKKKPKQGEESVGVPTIIMSEEASGSEARMESVEFGDDSATVASESFRSDSMTPPGSDFDPMDKPRFAKTLRGVTCTLGETAVLECETDGSPEPSVTWLRDNQKIVKSKRLVTSSAGQKHSLTIKDACADDGGLYTVVATNSKGSASCSAPLNLKLSLLGLPKEDSRPTTPGGTILPHAPVFKVKLNKETQLLEGTSVRFELVVRGNPEPEVKL